MFAVDDLTDAELANIKGGSWTKLVESLIMPGLPLFEWLGES